MIGWMQGLQLAGAALPLFQKRKSGGNIRQALLAAQQEQGAAGAEAGGLEPSVGAADNDFRLAMQRRLAQLSNVGTPEEQAARMQQLTAGGRGAYEAASSRLRQNLEDRGIGGSSIAGGSLAALESSRAANEARAGSQVALEQSGRQDAAAREGLGMLNQYAGMLRSRLERARMRADRARAQAAQIGAGVDRQDLYDQQGNDAAFGAGSELLAELLQNVRW
jgi:hypothetical protein